MALKKVEYPVIQKKYLAQLFRISRVYAEEVYNLLPKKKFSFAEVEEASLGAERAGKEQKFCPSLKSDRLVGKCPVTQVYNV